MYLARNIKLFITFFAIILVFTANSIALPTLSKGTIPISNGENILAAGNWNHDLGASSDLTLIIRLDVDGKTVIDEGYKVKYLINTIKDEGPEGCFKREFDDSAWQDGEASVGYGDTDDWTITPASILSVYTRYRFNVDNANNIKQVSLFVDWDDFYMITINGVEVARDSSLNAIVPQPTFPKCNANLPGGHGATELPKGRPNPARWVHPKVDRIENIKFEITNYQLKRRKYEKPVHQAIQGIRIMGKFFSIISSPLIKQGF